jgi:5-methylcytosine-specific restriction enzyme A
MQPSWRRWYGLERWRKIAKRQMRDHPLCCLCLKQGLVKAAEVTDHVTPHRGDPQQFWFGKLQSLCKPCHDSVKRREDNRLQRYLSIPAIGPDGWPLEPREIDQRN